jgi:hypothetical protein
MLATSKYLSLLAGVVLTISVLFSADTLPNIPLCWFKNWTGLPCPGCGLTHSVCALSHGRFVDAWHYHPFGYPIYLFLVLSLFSPIVVWRFPVMSVKFNASPLRQLGPLAFAMALLVFGIARLLLW